jgi:hypothetical protein
VALDSPQSAVLVVDVLLQRLPPHQVLFTRWGRVGLQHQQQVAAIQLHSLVIINLLVVVVELLRVLANLILRRAVKAVAVITTLTGVVALPLAVARLVQGVMGPMAITILSRLLMVSQQQ